MTQKMISPFQQQHFPTSNGTEKLIPHLGQLEKYVVHYRNLKIYLELGFIVKNTLFRTFSSRNLSKIIHGNIEQRRKAARIDEYARLAIFKLAMNAVFSKTVENVQTHLNIELLTSSKIAKEGNAKPNFKGSKRFHDDLLTVELTRPNFELIKTIQVDF